LEYKYILENISDWLWAVDTSGRYTYCSENVFDFLGYSAEEVIGKTPFDFMNEKESLRVSKIFEDLVIRRTPIKGLENTNIHKDGSTVILKTSGVPVYDKEGNWVGYQGTDTNITEKKILEQTKVNYDLLHKLTETVPGAIFQYRLYPDGKANYLYISQGIENIYEVSQEDVLEDASLIFKKIHPDDLNMVDASIKESVDTMKEFNLEYRVNLEKKGLRWLHEKAKIEKLEDGSILWYGVINDITEQVESKQKLVLLHEALQSQVEKNKLLLEENKLFISHMAHQMRTPLSVIMINSSLIELGTKNQISGYVTQINSAINMLSNSYEDLSYIISSDTIEYKPIKIDLTEFLQERVAFFELIAQANGKSIYTDITYGVDVSINDTELERLIDNNLSNAIKHSYDKSEIGIVLEKNHSDIILRVISKGKNIIDNSKIFDKNYTESNHAKRNLGLGLNMVKNICEKNHINYSVHSEAGNNIFTYYFKTQEYC